MTAVEAPGTMQAMLVQRMKFLQMVQEQAAKDVEQCVDTVGLDALLLKDPPPLPSLQQRTVATAEHHLPPQQPAVLSPTGAVYGGASPQEVAMRGVLGGPQPKSGQKTHQRVKPSGGTYDDGAARVGANIVRQHKDAQRRQKEEEAAARGPVHGAAEPQVGLSEQQKLELASIVANFSINRQQNPSATQKKKKSKGPKKSKNTATVQTEAGPDAEVRERSTSPLRAPSPLMNRTNSQGGMTPGKKNAKSVRLNTPGLNPDDLAMSRQQSSSSAVDRPGSAPGGSRPSPSGKADVLRISPQQQQREDSSKKKSNSPSSAMQHRRTSPISKEEALRHFNNTKDSLLATLEAMEGELGDITTRMENNEEREAEEERQKVEVQHKAEARRQLEREIEQDEDIVPTREWKQHLSSGDDQHATRSSLASKKKTPASPRLRGTIPPEMVHSIVHNKDTVSQYVKHNESLWNSSPVSQHVFAERLTKSLLQDLVSEVLDEVDGMLDEYVDGLVSYELQ